MQHFAQMIQTLAERLDGLGLAIVAFVDSASLPLPEVADLQIVYLTMKHPARWLYYTAMATGGSLVGSSILYGLARKGGDAFIRRRFHERHIERGMAVLRKYGLLAVIIPSMLPPPMPFKIFILLAGVAGVPAPTFAIALVLGRGLRYGGEALLAMFYGDRVAEFIKANFATVSLWTLILSAVVILTLIVWRRVRKA